MQLVNQKISGYQTNIVNNKLHTTYFDEFEDLIRNKSGLTIFWISSFGAIIQCTPAAASTTALL